MLHQLLNINRLTTMHYCTVAVSNVLFSVDAVNELTDKITQFTSNVCLSYSAL